MPLYQALSDVEDHFREIINQLDQLRVEIEAGERENAIDTLEDAERTARKGLEMAESES